MGKANICVLMWYDNGHKKWGDINYKINKAYCDKHGYDIIRDADRRIPHRQPNFERIALAQKHLPHYEHVIWLDADAHFYIDSPPIHLLINDYSKFDFILSADSDRVAFEYRNNACVERINSGVFIAKNTAYSMEILDLWGFSHRLYEKRLGFTDQGVLRLLHRDNISEFKEHSVVLPFGFLQVFKEEQRDLSHANELLAHYNMEKEYIMHRAARSSDRRKNSSLDYYNHHINKK